MPDQWKRPCNAWLAQSGLDAKTRAQALYVRGRGRHRSYQIPLAALDYEEALKLDPTRSDIYVDRANTKLRDSDVSGGMADLEIALRLDGRNTNAMVAMGVVLRSKGQVHRGAGRH